MSENLTGQETDQKSGSVGKKSDHEKLFVTNFMSPVNSVIVLTFQSSFSAYFIIVTVIYA